MCDGCCAKRKCNILSGMPIKRMPNSWVAIKEKTDRLRVRVLLRLYRQDGSVIRHGGGSLTLPPPGSTMISIKKPSTNEGGRS